MSQDFQSIGQASNELEAVVAQKQGWQGQPVVRDQVDEFTRDGSAPEGSEAVFSFRARRANRQALGFPGPGKRGIPNMAGYEQGNMAGEDPDGWDAYRP
ncbi:MAG: hypothetical protein ACR2JC_20840 [Chloroflexota bacterium]